MAGVPPRDPLSVRYDGAARLALHRAIIAQRSGKGVRVRINSPGPELRRLDVGGLTAHERAFTRACYYPVFKVPRNAGVKPRWSLKMTWDKGWARKGDRYGRQVTVRLYRYGAGRRHAEKHAQWITNDAARATPGQVGHV